jgi:hypothetical protein
MNLNHNLTTAHKGSPSGNLPSVRMHQLCAELNEALPLEHRVGWLRNGYTFSIYNVATNKRFVDNKSGGEALQFLRGMQTFHQIQTGQHDSQV